MCVNQSSRKGNKVVKTPRVKNRCETFWTLSFFFRRIQMERMASVTGQQSQMNAPADEPPKTKLEPTIAMIIPAIRPSRYEDWGTS